MSIKIAIADDHAIILDSLSKVLEGTGYIKICGTYLSGEELTEGLKKEMPEILLLDYHFPEQDGIQLAKYITYHHPDIKIIILTGFDKPGLAAEMLECGCIGYMLKSSVTVDTILQAIDCVAAGQIYMDGL